MSETRFTRGEWRREGVTIYELDNGPRPINRWTAHVQRAAGANAATPEEREHIAVLMAAAPDLYRELMDALQVIEAIAPHVVNLSVDGAIAVNNAIQGSRAALAKATPEGAR